MSLTLNTEGWLVDPDEPQHTCWDRPDWAGILMDDCAGCDYADAHKCEHCGYGHLFTTHNDELHPEGELQLLKETQKERTTRE